MLGGLQRPVASSRESHIAVAGEGGRQALVRRIRRDRGGGGFGPGVQRVHGAGAGAQCRRVERVVESGFLVMA